MGRGCVIMAHLLADIDNDELIYVNVEDFGDDEYMGERERIAEVIELHATTGEDLTYWYDRSAIVDDMSQGAKRLANARRIAAKIQRERAMGQ
jgi:hypothetical protein